MPVTETFNIDAASNSIARSVFPVIRNDGFTTSSLAVSNALTGTGLSRVNERILEVIRGSFPNDEFSADIASYAYIEAFQERAVELWAAIHGSERPALLARIDGLRDNKDDIKTVQSADDYNIEIMPMHAQLVSFEAAKKEIRDKLRNNVTIDVLPAASLDDWKAACHVLRSLPKGKEQALKALENHFNEIDPDSKTKIEFGALASGQLVSLKSAINAVLSGTVFADLAVAWPSSESMNEHLNEHLVSGSIEEKVTWPQVVNRIEAVTPSAIALSDMRIAGQYNSVSSFVMDFSTATQRLELSAMDFAAADDSSIDARFFTHNDADQLAGDNVMTAPHEAALLYHILAYAGLDIHLSNRHQLSGQRLSRPKANVPLSWNIMHPFFEARLRDTWRIFLPKLGKINFWEELLPIVKTRQSTFKSIDKLLPPVTEALRADFLNIITVVREAASEGANFDSAESIKDSISRFTHYKDEVVTPFNDLDMQVTTNAENAIASKSITGMATRPLGVIAHPTASKRGFSEAILAQDKNCFGAVTASSNMEDVAKLYNAVTDFTGVRSHSVIVDLNISNALSSALWDCHHDLIRETDRPFANFRASDAIGDASFVNLSGDFHAMIKRETVDNVMLASGYASGDLSMNIAGNVFGSFVYGTFTGRADRNDENAYNKQFITSLNEIASMVRDSYFPQPVSISVKQKSDISLKEENVSYIKRFMMIPDYFKLNDQKIDALRFQTVLYSPLADESFKEALGYEVMRSLRHYDYLVREDVESLIGLASSRLMNNIKEGYSSDVIDLYFASINGMLSVEQRQTLMRHEVREGVNTLTKRIGDIIRDCSEPLRVLFLNDVLNKFQAEYEKRMNVVDYVDVNEQDQ